MIVLKGECPLGGLKAHRWSECVGRRVSEMQSTVLPQLHGQCHIPGRRIFEEEKGSLMNQGENKFTKG